MSASLVIIGSYEEHIAKFDAAAADLFANKNAREEIIIGSFDQHLTKFEAAAADLFAIVQTPDAVDDLSDENAQAAFVKAFRDLIRIRNVLASFSEFDETILPVEPQDFEDFKSKYVDLAHRLTRTDEEKVPPAFDGIDFELELIRRDDINLSYIIALLTSMNQLDHDNTEGLKKAKQQRRRIFELLHSEVSLRGKRPYIERFIDQKLPMLDPDADIGKAFSEYWLNERAIAFKNFEEKHGLKGKEFQSLVSQMMFSGKSPLADDIMQILEEKPTILRRRKTVEAIISGINGLVDVFDDGVGDFCFDWTKIFLYGIDVFSLIFLPSMSIGNAMSFALVKKFHDFNVMYWNENAASFGEAA